MLYCLNALISLYGWRRLLTNKDRCPQMVLWSVVKRLFVRLVISCSCNCFSISDTQPTSLDE